ncbi:MAG: 4Fe-4S dicluster domain-containing protein [bacterium]|nr:4Fe-4S dicluster domain-containing protein [bacterium]
MQVGSAKLLQYGRRLGGALIFILLVLFFAAPGDVFPQAAQWATRLQVVPALLAGAWLVPALLALATLVFGRVYCSLICPLGLLQDLLGRLYPKKYRSRPRFRPPSPRLRQGIVIFFLIVLIFGNTVLLSLLEPYSLFGIMAVHLFKQGWISLNNMLAQFAPLAAFLGLHPLQYSNLGLVSFLVAVLLLVFFAVFVLLRGRDYCGRLCPVGTVLGRLGRFALLRLRFEEEQCVHCGRCERVCKTSCLDIDRQEADYSRCVVCFNCVAACPHKALRYGLPQRRAKTQNALSISENGGGAVQQSASLPVYETGRRQFVGLHLAAASGMAALAVTHAAKRAQAGLAGNAVETGDTAAARIALTPPGSGSRSHFSRRCTACQLCVARCPSRVLRPSTGEYGLLQILQPRMDFHLGFCNYDCVVCSQVCPSGAILPFTVPEKHETQTGNVNFIQHLCVVESKQQSCGACAEHCPTLAVKMVPYDQAPHLTIPTITPDLCVGCGACEYACPVVPDKAIYVQGLLAHKKARILPKGQEVERQVEGFGF